MPWNQAATMLTVETTNKLASQSDEELVELSQGGRNDAFRELMRRHYIPALHVAVGILAERQQAEEEIQDAFWNAYQQLKRFSTDSPFSSWTMCAVVNRCLKRRRAEAS